MSTRTILRLTAGVVVTVVAFIACGVSGLWGVALAAPVLVFAPHAVKSGLVEAKAKRQFRAELARIPGWKARG